jgi:hypothetical protein
LPRVRLKLPVNTAGSATAELFRATYFFAGDGFPT